LDEDQDERVRGLEDNFNQLLDGISLSQKPNCSEERLDGVHTGFERSKKIFKELLNESLLPENT
jgi:hypothetical protein